jgi:hypothetical protein
MMHLYTTKESRIHQAIILGFMSGTNVDNISYIYSEKNENET